MAYDKLGDGGGSGVGGRAYELNIRNLVVYKGKLLALVNDRIIEATSIKDMQQKLEDARQGIMTIE